MFGNSRFVENLQIAAGLLPSNLAAGANNGAWINLQPMHALGLVLIKAAGAAGEDPVLALQQATDVAGTGARALRIHGERVHKKQGAALGALATFESASADVNNAGAWTDAAAAEQQALVVVEVRPEDLDEGYSHVRAVIADVGNTAQLAALLAIGDMKDHRDPTKMRSIIG